MKLYSMTLECITTKEVVEEKIFLHPRDYKKMKKRINEVVYMDNNKEWALKKITT